MKLITSLLAGLCCWSGSIALQAEERAASDTALTETLKALCTAHGVPALAAAAYMDGKLVQLGTAGVRKVGSETPVTVDDQWHIGSLTKSMTASLAAMLVEDGRLRWDSTVGELLHDSPKIWPDWKGVSLEQLLQHRGGAPAEPPKELWEAAWKQLGTPSEQRAAFVTGLLAKPPDCPPGKIFAYSNQGYTIAGAMIEKATGKRWEETIRERLFKPLGMTSAGFGAPGTAVDVVQPWGHKGSRAPLEAQEPGPGADNPQVIAPAGTVHCSIADLARYAGWHATSGRGFKPALLGPGSFARLHQPAQGESFPYAMGWIVESRPWAGGKALTHSGTNTLWFATIWIAPSRGAAFVAATNCASNRAFGACDAAISHMVKRALPAP